MKTYDEYENLYVGILSDANVDVSALPLIDDLNVPRVLTKPRIYVIYTGSTFADLSNFGDYAQEETMSFEVYIQAQKRDGANGIFATAEEAIQRIIKTRMPDSRHRTTLQAFGYVTGIQNSWQYRLTFTFPRIRVMREVEIDYGLIKKITTNLTQV